MLCLSLGSLVACGLDPNAPEEPNANTSLGSGAPESGGPTGDTNSANPVAACEALEDTLAACVPSLAGTLQCSSFGGHPCDITAYFDCLNDAYGSCSGGTFPDLDPLSLQDCAALAVCGVL
ncbi:hypothetical protein DB30_04822 [Enhygromyxa salina]|uniref:Uncharacterized protein n=2 Tax=Enhygromyxa salina TaxID=215803 RepID=A0A0C2D3A0_9BACT|nr:hypothetical protein DB30_04822 [Enhygromyxa salina]